MSSFFSEESSSAGSDASSLHPRDVLKQELPNTLPALLDQLGISFGNVHHVGTGETHIVFGFTDAKKSTEYVIRVVIELTEGEEEMPSLAMADQVAILKFLERRSRLFGCVPVVTHFDTASKNPISRPYMIETRILGENLSSVWGALPLADKKHIIKQVVQILQNLENIRFPKSGALQSKPEHHKGYEIGDIKQLGVELGAGQDGRASIGDFLRHMLDFQFDKIRKFDEKLGVDRTTRSFRRLYDIFSDMEDVGYFQSPEKDSLSNAVFFHDDLHVGNLIVQRDPSTNDLNICGVIDWDNADARPLLFSRIPPYWLWYPDEVTEDEELLMKWNQDFDHLPNDKWALMSPEEKELKRFFDGLMQAQIPDYADYAYGRGRWVRRLAKFAMWGICDFWEYDMVDCLVEEWKEFFSAEFGNRSRLAEAGDGAAATTQDDLGCTPQGQSTTSMRQLV